jgi:hypothetical protein
LRPARRPGSTSPTAGRNGRAILRAASLALALCLSSAGCGPSGTPEDEIRALVDAAETAAEAREASELRALIADDYADAHGRTAVDVRRLLQGYLIAHQSIRLITRIDSIELQGNELARVRVTVGMLGREADAGSDWDLAGDIHRLDLRLAREDGEWRVIRGGRQEEQ